MIKLKKVFGVENHGTTISSTYRSQVNTPDTFLFIDSGFRINPDSTFYLIREVGINQQIGMKLQKNMRHRLDFEFILVQGK